MARGLPGPGSRLARRLVLVQEQVRAVLDLAPPGPLRAISVCAGQSHDLIGALVGHPRQADVAARLVELDEHNVLCAPSRARGRSGWGGGGRRRCVDYRRLRGDCPGRSHPPLWCAREHLR